MHQYIKKAEEIEYADEYDIKYTSYVPGIIDACKFVHVELNTIQTFCEQFWVVVDTLEADYYRQMIATNDISYQRTLGENVYFQMREIYLRLSFL